MKKLLTFGFITLAVLVSMTSCKNQSKCESQSSEYRVVDIEHHFAIYSMLDEYYKRTAGMSLVDLPEDMKAVFDRTMNFGEGRLKDMDEAGVDYVHMSLTTPGAEWFEPETGKKIAAEANDIIAKAVAEYPDRFGGWITIYPEDVEWSVKEIDRAAAMGLYGWSCLSNMNGKYLDDPKYWPIFKKLEELGMPVYLHPEFSPVKEIAEFGYCMNGPSLGFMVDALTCFMRMLCRGLFDYCPNLKIIMGHDGEALPFLLNRIDTAFRQGIDKSLSTELCNYKQAPSYYVEHNLWLTTSGNFSQEALRCCIDAMPEGHVMVSTDYPYEDFAGTINFIRDNEKLTPAEKKATLADNAMKLGFGRK